MLLFRSRISYRGEVTGGQNFGHLCLGALYGPNIIVAIPRTIVAISCIIVQFPLPLSYVHLYRRSCRLVEAGCL